MSEYAIGSTIKIGDVEFRVVRIIGQSVTLFEDTEGSFLLTESYIELKGSDNTVEFIRLTVERTPYTGPVSIIKGLDPIKGVHV